MECGSRLGDRVFSSASHRPAVVRAATKQSENRLGDAKEELPWGNVYSIHCPYITLGKALMHRRRFLRSLAASTLCAEACSALSLVPTLGGPGLSESDAVLASPPAFGDTVKVDVEGHTLLSQFEFAGVKWKAYEDLRTRDGVFTLI